MQVEKPHQNPAPKLLLTMEEAAQMLSLGRTYFYDLVMRNQIVSVKIGRKRRIPIVALHAYVDRLMQVS